MPEPASAQPQSSPAPSNTDAGGLARDPGRAAFAGLPGRALPGVVRVAVLLLLALASTWMLAPALEGTWVYDDLSLVERAPQTRTVEAALDAFWDPLWGFDDPRLEGRVGFWRPLTVLVLAGVRGAPEGAELRLHLASLGLHLLAVLVAYRLVRRLTGHDLGALACAGLFALHPVQVQSVAWISAVNDPLWSLFGLLGLERFVAWRRRGSRGAPLATAACFALALLCKEQALVLLPLVLLLDGLALGFGRRANGELPPAALAHGLAGLVFLAWYGLRASVVFGDVAAGLGGSWTGFGLGAGRMALLRFEVLGGFLRALLWPSELPFFHPVTVAARFDPANVQGLVLAGLLLIGLLLAGRARRRGALLALLALVTCVLPVVAAPENAGAYPVADRYLYLAVLPLSVLAVAACARLGSSGPLLLGVVLVPLAVLGHGRAGLYTDNLTFHRSAVRESPSVGWAHIGLGREHLLRHQRDPHGDDLDHAMAGFLAALTLGKDYGERQPDLGAQVPVEQRLAELLPLVNDPRIASTPDPYVMVSGAERVQANLGQAWCYLLQAEDQASAGAGADYQTPADVFHSILTVVPDSVEAHTGLGVALLGMGEAEAAREELARATQLNPLHVEAWTNLGRALNTLGRPAEARTAFQEAVRLRPDLQNQVLLATATLDAGSPDAALPLVESILEEYPRDPQGPYLRGVVAFQRRDLPGALEWFDRALLLEPDFGLAHALRGKVLMMQQERAQAIDALGRACELLPRNFLAHYDMARLLLERPDTREGALDYLLVAYRESPAGTARTSLEAALAPFLVGVPDTTMNLATHDRRRRDPEAALRWTERVLTGPAPWSERPDRGRRVAQVHVFRGGVFETLERDPEAAREYLEALDAYPDSFEAHHNLGLLYCSTQQLELARPHLQRALELLPEQEDTQGLVRAQRSLLTSLRDAIDRQQAELIGPLLDPGDRTDRELLPGGD